MNEIVENSVSEPEIRPWWRPLESSVVKSWGIKEPFAIIYPSWIGSYVRGGLAKSQKGWKPGVREPCDRHFINLSVLVSQGLDEDFVDKKIKKWGNFMNRNGA